MGTMQGCCVLFSTNSRISNNQQNSKCTATYPTPDLENHPKKVNKTYEALVKNAT